MEEAKRQGGQIVEDVHEQSDEDGTVRMVRLV
jgi:hypothetical protein